GRSVVFSVAVIVYCDIIFIFYIIILYSPAIVFPYTALFRSAFKLSCIVCCLFRSLTDHQFNGSSCIPHSPFSIDSGTQGENDMRSEEHTSELQSRGHLVCRLLLETKKR